jgi:tetratricopeptide (TPR) repeat protein
VKRNEFKDAQNCLQKALELNPKNPHVYLSLENVHQKQDQLEEELDVCKIFQKLGNSMHGKKRIANLESIIKLNKEKIKEEQRHKALDI